MIRNGQSCANPASAHTSGEQGSLKDVFSQHGPGLASKQGGPCLDSLLFEHGQLQSRAGLFLTHWNMEKLDTRPCADGSVKTDSSSYTINE